MFLHKYVVDGKTLFILSEKSSKPSGTFSIQQGDWKGRALGRYKTIIHQIESLTFTRKDTAEKKEKTKESTMVQRILQAFNKD